MSKSFMIRARIEPDLNYKVEKILHKIGLNTTQAITIFYKRILMDKGIPFEVKIPNATTRKVFEETDNGIDIHTSKDTKTFLKDVGLRWENHNGKHNLKKILN